MSPEMARFLIELLHGEEDAIEAIEKQMFDEQLTPEQRNSLIDLQTRYENLCDFLRQVIKEHQ
jgi:hypothetical protein